MAKEGLAFFLPALIVTIIVWGFWVITSQISLLIIGILTTILTLFFALFFRDPNRVIPEGDGILVSPADGFVSAIKQLDSHPFLNSAAIQISIFLTVFDVHINRIPISGVIENVEYKAGKFMVAYKDHASDENERTEISMVTNGGAKVVFRQIAGQLARRIVCKLKRGQEVNAGDRFGMIKFSSRTDLIVPEGTKLEIEKGQHVKGGSTIIGRLPMSHNRNSERSHSGHNNAEV